MATLHTLVVKLVADADNLTRGLKESESHLSRFMKSSQALGKAALGGIGLATGAAAGLGAAMVKLAADAAPLQTVRESFEGLAQSAGKSGEEMLAALQRGSSGMIAQRDLMLSFNKAAQLVSTDFATKLPDAMQYLSKVSAATGQDMGFLLDSLVTGVGRLSPMILDNLAIQVNLNEAYEKYAQSIGKSAKELTKQEQQTALMNQVLEKLAANTASMPDVSNTAAAGMARLQAQLQNTKDAIGMALVPALNTMLQAIQPILTEALPRLVVLFQENVIPIVERSVGAIASFVTGFDKVSGVIDRAIDAVRPYVKQMASWIGRHVKLRDVMTAVAITIASVVIPAIISLITAAAPLIATFAAIVAAVALLRKVWENDWGGIRTTLTRFWQRTGRPVLDGLLRAMKGIWSFLNEYIFPVMGALINVWLAGAQLELRVLAGIWENILMPALRAAWRFIDAHILPIFEKLAGAIKGVVEKVQSLADWLNGLADRLRDLSIPDWLTPGSPTPFELGLKGISKAMRELATMRLPALQVALQAPQLTGAATGGKAEVHHHYNLTINSQAKTESILADFQMMKALAL